jgi:hypothetical protein
MRNKISHLSVRQDATHDCAYCVKDAMVTRRRRQEGAKMLQDDASVTALVQSGFRKLGLPFDEVTLPLVPELPLPPAEAPLPNQPAGQKIKIVISDSTR